jgi:hypothetical protein
MHSSLLIIVVVKKAGHVYDQSPSGPTEPDLVETKRATSTPSVPKNVTDLRNSPGYGNVDIFTYEEMKLATKQFRPDYILGEGGFGVVYKGVIDESVRTLYKTTYVAIKELNPDGLQGDREWLVFTFAYFLRTSISFLCYSGTNYLFWVHVYYCLNKWLEVGELNFLLIWIRSVVEGLSGRLSYVSINLWLRRIITHADMFEN